MLVQRISALAVCSALLAACSTHSVQKKSNVPVTGSTQVTATMDAPRYIAQPNSKLTAQQYALQQRQQDAARKRGKIAEQQRQQWAQERARNQQAAQQRYEEEKQRITRLKYHQKYKQEQLRLAQEKLRAEQQRLIRLEYQRKYEAEQQRKAYAQKAAEAQRLAAQQASQQRQQAAIAEQKRLARQQEAVRRQQLAQQQKNDKIRARSLARYRENQAKQQAAARSAAQTPLTLAGGQGSSGQALNHNTPVAYQQARSNTFRGAGWHSRLPGDVAHNLRLRGISARGMSAYVRPANGRGPAVLTAAADTPRNPASTMKLVTTYAALGALGPNYQWPTEIYITGPIVQGTLRGDVVIKGYGNPDFSESDLRHLLGSLRHRGIKNIAGNLVADNSHFNIPHQKPGSFDGKSGAAYNAQPEALLYQGRGSSYRFRNLSKRVQRHTRKMPRSKGGRSDLNTNLFGAFWKVWVGKMGGGMQGRFRKGVVPQGAQLVFSHRSKPLRHILPTINKKSNNVMARQLMLTVGAQRFGAPGTPGKGAMAIGQFMESRGLHFPELRIENGSGLSRVSRISARNLGEMLVNAYNSPWRHDFMNSLAVLGVDGTLRNRMRKSGLAGRGRFKTGTLRNVRGLAGYVQASNGQMYVVSILHNDRKARSSAKKAHDELVKWVYWGARNNFVSR